MAHVALIGASGQVGSRLLDELSRRGHRVTALARNIDKIPTLDGVQARAVDASDPAALAAALRGHDAVISTLPFASTDAAALIETVKQAKVPRYLVVGGAGSLQVQGHRVVDLPEFPAEYKVEATAGAAFLERLKREHDLYWTFLSPSALLLPGERTGTFRLGKDELLSTTASGSPIEIVGGSRISIEDFAIAMIDELEQPQHSRQRFTVGY